VQIEEKYKHTIIKEYHFWTLCLSLEQLPHVGRCLVWWKDRAPGEGERMPPWEVPEFAIIEREKTIYRHVYQAWAALGYATEPYGDKSMINIPYFANGLEHNHHMHVWLVPRTELTFVIPEINLTVHDPNWGNEFAQREVENSRVTDEQFEYIRKTMADAIG
jgi:hypothetical protein